MTQLEKNPDPEVRNRKSEDRSALLLSRMFDVLLLDGINHLLRGNITIAKKLIGTHISSTIGFDDLSIMLGKNRGFVRRMFSPKANPRVSDFMKIVRILIENRGIEVKVDYK